MSERHCVSNEILDLEAFTDNAGGGNDKGFGLYFQGQSAHGR